MSEHDDDSETKKEVEALLDRLASRGEDGDAAKAEKLREFYALDPDDPLRLNFVHLRLLLEPGLAEDKPAPNIPTPGQRGLDLC